MWEAIQAIEAARMESNPYLYPGVLIVVGLLACFMASVRTRVAPARWPRLVVASYAALAVFAFLAGGAVLFYRAQLFWGARWDASANVLVLERMAPFAEIRIPKANLLRVTEFSTPEHTLTGLRQSTQFVVYTRSGDAYWSAPIYRRGPLSSARRTLIATGLPRLERFLIGDPSLPQ